MFTLTKITYPHLPLFLFQEADYPTVLVAMFVEYPTPFIREYFQRVANFDYPKSKIQIYIHNNVSEEIKH